MNNKKQKIKVSPTITFLKASTTQCFKHTVFIDKQNVTSIAINIKEYDKNKDILSVIMNGKLLILNKDYTVDDEGKHILAVGDNTWNPHFYGVTVTFTVLKEKEDTNNGIGIPGPVGPQGPRGKSLEFAWRGTELGIRVEGESEYQFVDLAGKGGSGGSGSGSTTVISREIELRKDENYIQWRYKNETQWRNLIAISELKGAQGLSGRDGIDGREVQLIRTSTGIKWKYSDEQEFDSRPLVELSELRGHDGRPGRDGVDGTNGREIELVKTDTDIKWGYVGESNKTSLLQLNEIKGNDGTPGRDGVNGKQIELVKTSTDIKWGYVGENKTTLVQLEDIKGNDGAPGRDGTNGTNGTDGVTPDIRVGTVTTLEAGSNATIVRTGTNEQPVFDFGIPKGDNGIYIGPKESAPESAVIVIDETDDGIYMIDELVETPINDGVLNLTLDKYQTTTMVDNTRIVLPTVNKFIEIHLLFDTTGALTLSLPNIKWQGDINIEGGKTYEFIFTYFKNNWLGGCIPYEQKASNR